MFLFLKRMWAAAPVATTVFAIALALCVFFGARATASWIYWNDPAHIDQPIEGWMTPRYVAMSWDVPRRVMVEALDLEQTESGPRNLRRLAEARGVSPDSLISELEAAIDSYRASQPDNGKGKTQ